MIVLSVDIFSGRPNPAWVLDEKEEKSMLKMIASKKDMVSRIDREFKGYENLGYRGIYVGLLSDDLTFEYNLPHHFMILNGAASQDSKDIEIGNRIISTMEEHSLLDEKETDKDQRKKLSGMFKKEMIRKIEEDEEYKMPYQPTVPDGKEVDDKNMESEKKDEKSGSPKVCCYIELCSYNPSYWNNCKTIKQKNNCYNYATNRRTDTFAQPGRASGSYPYSISCNNVKNGALSDGAHVRYDCFPSSEAPRYLMAMAVWPGYDYHWYRKHCEGFWGHKPGSTSAKNTDNSGNIIYDPQTCNRGNYTDFCSYFYACKSMTVS